MLGTIAQTNRRVRVVAPFDPLPWQVAPWRDKSPVLLLTGSAGGGKSRLAAEKLHGYCLKYPGATALLLRKARVSITNSTAELLRRAVIGGDPRVIHVPSKSRFDYRSGSVLMYAGLDDEGQRQRLRSIGAEGGVDIAWLEEATEFSEDDYNAVLARLRGQVAPWRQILLTTNPDAPTHWIYRRLIVGGEAHVYYSAAADNLHNPNDYYARLGSLTGVEGDRLARGQWVQATGIVYDVWSDGPPDGNVTEAAEYISDAGEVYWAVDDGYEGKLDSATGQFTERSSPRVFLLVQQRGDGRLCVFAEHYAVKVLQEEHIRQVVALDYPEPDYAVVDSAAAELRGRLLDAGIATFGKPGSIEESIKTTRRMLAPDTNGRRRVLVHPRCTHLRAEMASYRRDDNGKPVDALNHGPDALRYLCWHMRLE
jgi:phage terminase large subunit